MVSGLTEGQLSKLKILYEKIKAIEVSIADSIERRVNPVIVGKYNDCVQDLWELLNSKSEENLISYKVNPEVIPSSFNRTKGTKPFKHVYPTPTFMTQVKSLIACLRTTYNLEEQKILETSKVIETIKDKELKDRCFDLLSAGKHFDRVIREATTILESRIRKRVNFELKEEGEALVTKVLHHDKGVLKLDVHPSEAEGYYFLFRGVMQSFRNQTHHKIIDEFTEDDTIKVIALIDILLELLTKYKKK